HELRAIACDLFGDVEEVPRIEADLERAGMVSRFEFLDGGAVFRTGRRYNETTVFDREFDCAALFRRDRRYSVDRFRKGFAFDLEDLVVVRWDDAVIVGEGAIDQLRRQGSFSDRDADLRLAEPDKDLIRAFLDQLSELKHRLARNDHTRNARGTLGQ